MLAAVGDAVLLARDATLVVQAKSATALCE